MNQSYTQTIKNARVAYNNAAERIKIARAALALTKTKLVYSIDDLTDGDIVDVIFYDQFETFYKQAIPKETLIQFAANHYRDTVDEFHDDCHYQYVDGRSAAEYVEENLTEVITDFLNNQ